jgi:hypothetical protein
VALLALKHEASLTIMKNNDTGARGMGTNKGDDGNEE